MSHAVIRTERLGKRFRKRAHQRLQDALGHTIPGSARAKIPKEFWALRDVTLNVASGESVALLGSNGAGKSVLLKILSRVTAPTEGRAEIHGRVGALLEVGAGFHPELSGRDNIYFNGAILGMPRDQIRRNFDEIVAFSEIEEFIDTPIKLYSSGMRMRLAFSVAVHLEPDILLIDEALSVGDASFRAKCRDKIAQFIRHGCTLLLVSHDAGVVQELCERAVLLQHGHLIDDGPTTEMLARLNQNASHH